MSLSPPVAVATTYCSNCYKPHGIDRQTGNTIDLKHNARWTSAATDYALEHGLIGLSLRPLAAEIGTSDRMLLYHFGTKDQLVAAILQHSTDRSSAHIEAIAPSKGLGAAVHDLWRETSTGVLSRCGRLYLEAAAMGLLGREPYSTIVREANNRWTAALIGHLRRSGVPPVIAGRAVTIIDAAFMGFQLDQPLDDDPQTRLRAVADLADAVVALSHGRSRAGLD